MRNYYNEATGIIIKFKANDTFVIVGDESKVSDATLLALHQGKLVEGWVENN